MPEQRQARSGLQYFQSLLLFARAFFALADSGADRFSWFGQPTGFAAEVESRGLAFVVLEGIDHDRVLALEGTSQQLFAERILDSLLDRTTQRTSTVVEVAALLDQEFLGIVGQIDDQAAFEQSLADLGQLEIDDTPLRSSLVRCRKMIVSSKRFRNSGRNTRSI